VAIGTFYDDSRDVPHGLFVQVKLRALTDPLFPVEVRKMDPGEVRQMTVLARNHEPYGHDQGPLVLGALVFITVPLGFKVIPNAGQSTAANAHEPMGELKGTDPNAQIRFPRVAFRRDTEVALFGELQLRIEGLEPSYQGTSKPLIVQELWARVAPRPMLQPANDDRAVDEVHHGARTKGGHQLTLP
jgi:hypothetical protein